MIHKIELSDYSAGCTGSRHLLLGTAGSYGIEYLQVSAGDGWGGMDITATFHAPDWSATRVPVGGDNLVEVPHEATAAAGDGKIVFVGTSDGVRRISCNVPYCVCDHAPVDGTDPQPPSPGVVDQILVQTANDRKAAQEAAEKAENALDKAPTVGENGNWYVWDAGAEQYIDTGRYSGGSAPYIGANGNWYIGSTDTGRPSRGADGKDGNDGKDGKDGNDGKDGIDGKTAYQYAVDGGYTGTEADFAKEIATAERRYTVKTVMDSVAVPHTQYFLGEQASVAIVLPDDAAVGQMVLVSWYNADTAATLSITGTMLDFDFTPSANTRSEINALWDGTYWAVLGNEMAVPSEVAE